MAESVKTLSQKLKKAADMRDAKRAESHAAHVHADALGKEASEAHDEYVRLEAELYAAVRREAGVK